MIGKDRIVVVNILHGHNRDVRDMVVSFKRFFQHLQARVSTGDIGYLNGCRMEILVTDLRGGDKLAIRIDIARPDPDVKWTAKVRTERQTATLRGTAEELQVQLSTLLKSYLAARSLTSALRGRRRKPSPDNSSTVSMVIRPALQSAPAAAEGASSYSSTDEKLSAPGPDEYAVYFGTNRTPKLGSKDSGFESERGMQLTCGRCLVHVPKQHMFGSTGSSLLNRIRSGTDDRLVLRTSETLNRDLFTATIADALGSEEQRKGNLLYIHGYNTSFEDAAIRAAQMGVDLKIPGITAFFSWPSKGTLKGYKPDEATIDGSEWALEEFIRQLFEISELSRLNIIAHSMGNRAMLRVAERLPKSFKKRLGQIILAAPDVDADVFKRTAVAYRTLANRTTLYVSHKDLAVGLSSYISDYERAGYMPPVTVVDGIDTVEVSHVDLTLLGHGYFAEAHAVLHDIFELIRRGTPPEERSRILRREWEGKIYWQIAR